MLQLPKSFGSDAMEAARLGQLNQLRISSRGRRGTPPRSPTALEWDEVEIRTQTIWAELSELDRRKFILTQVPGWLPYLTSGLLGLTVIAVLAAYGYINGTAEGFGLGAFILFVVALGIAGAGASVAMNALSLQEDATFDLSSRKFVWLRLVLGALFGTLLTVTWGYPVFRQFIQEMSTASTNTLGTDEVSRALYLLAPFVFGFSTSVVILVLSRAVEGVQTIFGKSTAK